MTLHISLSPELEHFISTQVAAGAYRNVDDLVGDAIRRLQTEEQRLAAWHSAIKAGEADLDRGDAEEFTPDLLERLTTAALTGSSTQAADPDVLP